MFIKSAILPSVVIFLAGLASYSPFATAQESSAASGASNQIVKKQNDLAADKNPERGWFFFEETKKPEEKKEDETEKPVKAPPPLKADGAPPPPKEEACKKKDTWKPECGFVDPGDDFSFQEKQRDAILQHMVMSKNNPKAVEAFQYYMRWLTDRASEIGNYWVYNAVQNPDLDPSVKAPVSTFGIRLVADIQDANDKKVFELLKNDGGFLLYFSKESCAYCHHMKGAIEELAGMTNLEVKNVSLEGNCLSFIKGECMLPPNGDKAAAALNVTVVPTLFLYIRPNTWIRIATGVVDATTMKNRAVQFFSAYRTALSKGMASTTNGRPTVDFSGGAPTGVANVKLPTQEDLEKQLGKKQ